MSRTWFDRPRLTGFFCAILATGIGIAYLRLGGAPARYVVMNLAALILGSSLLFLLRPNGWNARTCGGICIAIGMLLNAVVVWGERMHGATRWLVVGGLSIEPNMIFLPFSVLLFAWNQNAYSAVGLIFAALSTAIQPDRSMAGAISLGLLALLIAERKRWTIIPFVVAVGAFVVTLLRPDTVPPQPFVERVFASAFALSRSLGLAVAAGAFILLFPGLLGLLRWPGQKRVYATFAGIWIGLLVAAAIGNYPTPVVGYSSSAILGYLLSIACFPMVIRDGMNSR